MLCTVKLQRTNKWNVPLSHRLFLQDIFNTFIVQQIIVINIPQLSDPS